MYYVFIPIMAIAIKEINFSIKYLAIRVETIQYNVKKTNCENFSGLKKEICVVDKGFLIKTKLSG